MKYRPFVFLIIVSIFAASSSHATSFFGMSDKQQEFYLNNAHIIMTDPLLETIKKKLVEYGRSEQKSLSEKDAKLVDQLIQEMNQMIAKLVPLYMSGERQNVPEIASKFDKREKRRFRLRERGLIESRSRTNSLEIEPFSNDYSLEEIQNKSYSDSGSIEETETPMSTLPFQ